MKYSILISIGVSILTVLIISGISVLCSSFDSFLNHIMRKEILIVSVMLTTALASFLYPLFKYIGENKK